MFLSMKEAYNSGLLIARVKNDYVYRDKENNLFIFYLEGKKSFYKYYSTSPRGIFDMYEERNSLYVSGDNLEGDRSVYNGFHFYTNGTCEPYADEEIYAEQRGDKFYYDNLII